MLNTEIITTTMTVVCTIICAVIGKQANKAETERKADSERVEKRAAQRAKEGRLQLAMLNANSKLTVGVAMALKRGHCNGEVEEGLKAIADANEEYEQFLEGIALDHLKK